MTTDTVTLFLALLAIVAEAAVLATVAGAVLGRFSPTIRHVHDSARDAVGPQALALAFVVAAISTAGSLYFSEVAHFRPCRLCWLQRACMYPLVPILGVAAWRRSLRLRPYAAALAAIGAIIASYHVLLERYPTLETDVCDPSNPCTLIWVRRFGYLTIPTMALSAFALILTLLALAKEPDALPTDHDDETSTAAGEQAPAVDLGGGRGSGGARRDRRVRGDAADRLG
jgi:disulfide bond formation protein DsbB